MAVASMRVFEVLGVTAEGCFHVSLSAEDRSDRKSIRHPATSRDSLSDIPLQPQLIFNCVVGSILMAWYGWLGGNVTSGIWYMLAVLTDRKVATLPGRGSKVRHIW